MAQPASLPILTTSAPPATLSDRVRDYARADKSEATRRAYNADWRRFTAWCAALGPGPVQMAPELVAGFLTVEADAGVKPSTITRRLAAISYAYGLAGQPSPAAHEGVRSVMRGIRREKGTSVKQKAPATADRVAAMVAAIPADTLQGKRDRALLLFGFAGAFRRSELVALDVEDLAFEPEGVRVTIRRSKTDQEGGGQEIAILRGKKLKPVAALQDWLKAAGISSGPVFRRVRRHGVVGDRLTAQSVALVVKAYAEAADVDPATFAGHSLRAGFLTTAAGQKNVDVLALMEVSRHKRVETLRGYVRRASLFKKHAGAGFL